MGSGSGAQCFRQSDRHEGVGVGEDVSADMEEESAWEGSPCSWPMRVGAGQGFSSEGGQARGGGMRRVTCALAVL